MPSIGDITGRILLVYTGTSAVKKFESDINGTMRTVEIAGGRLTASIEGLFTKTALLATAGIVARAGFQFLKESAGEAIEAERAFAQLRAGVISTGGAAGKSAEELSAMADELSKMSGFDDEIVAGGEAILLTFRRVRGEAFEQTMRSALDLSARFGKDIDSSVTMIAKALDTMLAGSTRGLAALSKAGVTFTDQQKKQLEALVKTGQGAKATELFFAELEAQFGGSAAAARDTLGGALGALGVAWSNLKEAVGTSGSGIRIVIEGLITLVEKFTRQWQLADLGITVVLLGLNEMVGGLENRLQSLLVTLLRVSAGATQANPFASDEQKIRSQVGLNNAILDQARKRVGFAERSRNLEAEIAQKTMALLGILPKVQSNYSDIADEIESAKSKQSQWFDDLIAGLARQTNALELLRQGMPVDQIENLVEAAEALGRTNLLDGLVLKAGAIKDRIDDIATAFKLADEAKKKFAELGTLDDLIQKQFDKLPAGSDDPEMQKLIATLRTRKQLTDATATAEEKRLATVREALVAGVEGEALQRIMLANADQWNIELDETQLKFNEIYERLSYVAEGIAFDLVSNWRRAWEENESITDATTDTLKDTLKNVIDDIIAHFLSQWAKAFAAWLAEWVATQTTAKAASAALGTGGSPTGVTWGMPAKGATSTAPSGGFTAGVEAYGGWALAAFALYVVYKGFVERERKKFAQITIADGSYQITASRGQKYLDGVTEAAESILAALKAFLDEIDVTMERLGTVIIESSKSGWNVSIPGSAGKLFASMEEAIAYAQVLMLKYGEFAESVSVLVRGVIQSTKAISIEELASDIAFAKQLETQNLEQSAIAIREAMDLAIAQWKRAEDLFLSFYDRNLPAFAEAATSILTRLGNSIWATYNQLAGIEEDPAKAWERKKSQYRVERMMIEAQIKLWALEIAARIANYNAQVKLIGGGGPGGGGRDKGGGSSGGGILGMAFAMVQAAAIVSGAVEVMDPALQALLDIQALITRSLQELPPIDLPDTDPGKGKGRGKGNKGQLADLREQLRDEIALLEAEAKGPLHSAFYDFSQSLAAFRERAKEAKLPAAELAKGVELLTAAFQRSIRQQAEDYAGLGSEFTKRLQDIQAFFGEVRALGRDKTGLGEEELSQLESSALARVGKDLQSLINDFAGLSDPMLAISTRADELRANVLAYAEAVGWSAEQIAEAIDTIEAGIDVQVQQGINSTLDRLFVYLNQAGLFQAEGIEFARQKSLNDILLIEAQLRFYGALTAQAQAWIDAAREFVLGPGFGDGSGTSTGGGRPITTQSDLSNMLRAKRLEQLDALQAEMDRARQQLIEDIENATELLRSYQTDAMEPLARQLLKINEDFTRIRAALGNTPEVIAAYNAAIGRAQKEASDLIVDAAANSIRSLIGTWRGAVEQLAQSTSDLLTDESFTNLTQAEQLEQARRLVAELAVKAQAGDLKALQSLDAARKEFLSELRESEGGGFGYDTGFEWVMRQTANVLANAQQAESSMIAIELAKTTATWADIMAKLTEDLNATFYDAIDGMIFAIYDAIGNVPSFASGGIVMSGPRLVRVAEYVPEAIVPLDRLSMAVPYRPLSALADNGIGKSDGARANSGYPSDRDSLARLSALEISNDKMAKSLSAIASDISSMARRGKM